MRPPRYDVAPFDLLAHSGEASAVQARALHSVADVTGAGRPTEPGQHFDRHAAREGFRAVAATAADGDLLGFGYGVAAQRGSWWDLWVRPAMTAAGQGGLMDDAFEVVQLMVDPPWHGGGIGRALLAALVDGVPHPRVLLTTQDGPNPARGFYARLGFAELARGPVADGAPYVVLGRELP